MFLAEQAGKERLFLIGEADEADVRQPPIDDKGRLRECLAGHIAVDMVAIAVVQDVYVRHLLRHLHQRVG